MPKPIKRNYISEIDQFLKEFDQQHPEKSASQQKEIAKHQRISALRDQAPITKISTTDKKIWDDF